MGKTKSCKKFNGLRAFVVPERKKSKKSCDRVDLVAAFAGQMRQPIR
jgi:hypothetical protein